MNNNNIWSDIKLIDYLNINNNEITNLPHGVSISTMCTSCKLNTFINILNIEKYLQLNNNDILCIKIDENRIRTLIKDKKKSKREKKNKLLKLKNKINHFYNQITVIIRINNGLSNNLDKEPKINLKLFKNGSIQMSGCKSITNINIVLNKLIYRLSEIKAVIENNNIVEKKFIDECSQVYISNFKIDMINSNYRVNMQIDRIKLFNLLLKKKIKSSFEPCIRACVIIKQTPPINNIELKEISIFIFQKGNIIITGAQCKSHIYYAYQFINNILITHYEEINKIDEQEEELLIMKLYNEVLKDIKNGLIINY